MGKNRILVVDDDHDILDLLEYNLEREGFNVRTVDGGTQAVNVCREFKPDLIILDIMMPGVNGIEVCKRIRMMDRFKDTFIFFLTAKSAAYYQDAAFEAGGNDFIEKIMGLRSLLTRVSTVLREKFGKGKKNSDPR